MPASSPWGTYMAKAEVVFDPHSDLVQMTSTAMAVAGVMAVKVPCGDARGPAMPCVPEVRAWQRDP